MNLLEDNMSFDINNDAITIDNFRKKQYELIPEICESCMNYINKQQTTPFSSWNIELQNRINYIGSINSLVDELKITTTDTEGNNYDFLDVFVPRLIEDDFFFLGGNNYIPTMYIVDNPIVIKNKSIKLSGLISNISIFIKDKFVTFLGKDIPLNLFLNLFIHDSTVRDEFIDTWGIEYKELPEEYIIEQMSQIFNIKKDINYIYSWIDSFFLDDYTKKLYSQTYNINNISTKKIVEKACEISSREGKPSFVDLTKKRVVFMELLLAPIFNRVLTYSFRARQHYKDSTLNLNMLSILKHFKTAPTKDDSSGKTVSGLANNYFYDCKNLYSSVLKYKCSMVLPNNSRPPREVKSVHPSHYRRICPITVSSQEPGKTVSVLPGVKLDKFGRFL